jgi:hypothetical protein
VWRKLVLVAAALLLPVGVLAEGARASADRYAQGDAHALLNTYPTTDQVLTLQEQDLTQHGLDIRPFQVYGDRPYCVDDWHLLALATWAGEFEATDPPITFTRYDAWATLNDLEATFTLDGAPVDLVTTPIKQVHSEFALTTFEPALEAFYGFDVTVGNLWGLQYGRIIPAGELAVGKHTFSASVALSDGTPWFIGTVRFKVSGPDSTACTGI